MVDIVCRGESRHEDQEEVEEDGRHRRRALNRGNVWFPRTLNLNFRASTEIT